MKEFLGSDVGQEINDLWPASVRLFEGVHDFPSFESLRNEYLENWRQVDDSVP